MRIKKISQSLPPSAGIIDNLESDSSTDALSAKQGKVLKSLIGQGGSINVIDNLYSTSTTDALSANMGKSLWDSKLGRECISNSRELYSDSDLGYTFKRLMFLTGQEDNIYYFDFRYKNLTSMEGKFLSFYDDPDGQTIWFPSEEVVDAKITAAVTAIEPIKVNNISPDDNKNILIDASNINVDETASEKVSIKDELAKKSELQNLVDVGTSGVKGKDSSVATGDHSFAFGNGARTIGGHSVAIGKNAKADTDYSFAIGYGAKAKSIGSMAIGNTEAYGKWQFTSGVNNIVDDTPNGNGIKGRYLHIVGNGTETEGAIVHSNAYTLDWEGNGWFQGKVRVGGNSYDEGEELLTYRDFINKEYFKFGYLERDKINEYIRELLDNTCSGTSAVWYVDQPRR